MDMHTNLKNLRCIAEHGPECVPDDVIRQMAEWAVGQIADLRNRAESAEAALAAKQASPLKPPQPNPAPSNVLITEGSQRVIRRPEQYVR